MVVVAWCISLRVRVSEYAEHDGNIDVVRRRASTPWGRSRGVGWVLADPADGAGGYANSYANSFAISYAISYAINR